LSIPSDAFDTADTVGADIDADVVAEIADMRPSY
jgi:hypothetical protein